MALYPVYTDEEYARRSSCRRRIAHGPLIYDCSVGLMPIEFGDAIVALIGATGPRHLARLRTRCGRRGLAPGHRWWRKSGRQLHDPRTGRICSELG